MKGKREVKMEVCMRLEGCSVPPGCCEAGPVKGELQTKVFYSSGLTVINESLNVGKHFISASSVFIRQGQPLAGRERAVTFITTTQKGEAQRLPIGLIKTPARPHDRSYSLLLRWHGAVINFENATSLKDDRCFSLTRCSWFLLLWVWDKLVIFLTSYFILLLFTFVAALLNSHHSACVHNQDGGGGIRAWFVVAEKNNPTACFI